MQYPRLPIVTIAAFAPVGAWAGGLVSPVSIERGVRSIAEVDSIVTVVEDISTAFGAYAAGRGHGDPIWYADAWQNSTVTPAGGFQGRGSGYTGTKYYYEGPSLTLDTFSWVEYTFELTEAAYLQVEGLLISGWVSADIINGSLSFAEIQLTGPGGQALLQARQDASPDFEEDTPFFTSLITRRPAGLYTLRLRAYGQLFAVGDEGTFGSGEGDWTVLLAATESPRPECPTIEPMRASVSSLGEEGNQPSEYASISSDGRFVAFESNATNLVSGVTGPGGLFIHDRITGETQLVGLESDAALGKPAVSASGEFVAFLTGIAYAPDDTDHLDVYLRDMATSEITLVSRSTTGMPANGSSGTPSISADGQVIAFDSYATNLTPINTAERQQVYVHERTTGTTTLVSIGMGVAAPNGDSYQPAVSADGRYVAFSSRASNLVPFDQNERTDAFLHDRMTGQTVCVSVDLQGLPAGGASVSVSADGRFVAFSSSGSDLVADDTNGVSDVFVRDMLVGETVRVSISNEGLQGNGGSGGASISGDGRFVAFSSGASNLTPSDTNGASDIFVVDRDLSVIRRVSIARLGDQANQSSYEADISADGQFVAYITDATNLVFRDTNEATDVIIAWIGDAFDVLPGDANDDARVDFTDLNAVISVFGMATSNLGVDLNGDGVVDFQDLNLVLSNFGRNCY